MAGKSAEAARGRRAWALARAQHGVIARRQLRELGFGRAAIEHRIARGRLHPVARGVYAVGRPQLTREGRWMAAVLAAGPGACLSHRSAAALFEIAVEPPGRIELSRRQGAVRRPGLRVHSRPSLRWGEVGTLAGIPVTAPAQTIVDLAAVCGPQTLERAVNEADKRDHIGFDELLAALGDHCGERGVARLRRLLDPLVFRLSDDELEVLFRPLARAAGLPEPLTKQWLNGFEVDFFWPALGLVVETDGLRYHRTPAQQARDRRRDQAHTAAGLVPLRFTHWQVKHEPRHVGAVLAATAAHRSRKPA